MKRLEYLNDWIGEGRRRTIVLSPTRNLVLERIWTSLFSLSCDIF